MPQYGVAQAGGNAKLGLNLTSLEEGQLITLIAAADAVAAAYKSVAFARAMQQSANRTITFTQSGCPGNTVTVIEAADADLDASYQTVGTITGNSFYTDIGASAFYRARVSSYQGSDVPVVTANRN